MHDHSLIDTLERFECRSVRSRLSAQFSLIILLHFCRPLVPKRCVKLFVPLQCDESLSICRVGPFLVSFSHIKRLFQPVQALFDISTIRFIVDVLERDLVVLRRQLGDVREQTESEHSRRTLRHVCQILVVSRVTHRKVGELKVAQYAVEKVVGNDQRIRSFNFFDRSVLFNDFSIDSSQTLVVSYRLQANHFLIVDSRITLLVSFDESYLFHFAHFTVEHLLNDSCAVVGFGTKQQSGNGDFQIGEIFTFSHRVGFTIFSPKHVAQIHGATVFKRTLLRIRNDSIQVLRIE